MSNSSDVEEALLHELSMAQLPDQVHPRAIAVLDRLLETVGSSVGLTGRR
ncbi:hypothetical protein [Streptomyces sp. AP-93]|nr:hypothetical protein [Streptomyces sp. AP-93]MCJ0875096.1 hypothetical protein [Streptomyces sp. AP-93]